MTVAQFDFLAKKIQKQYKITEKKRLSARKRVRGIGSGRPFKLSARGGTLVLLIHCRCHTSYGLLEYLFGVDSSTACRGIARIESAVKCVIPIPVKLYADSKKINGIRQLLEFFPGLIAITDGAGQQIPRPENKKRKTHCSGKRKGHAIKNQITVNLNGGITQTSALPWTKK